MINIDERQINYKCLNRNSAQDGDIYLLKDGKIVSSEDVNKIGETAVLTEDVLTVGYDTAEKGFRVTAVIDRNSLLDDLKKTRNRILLTAVLLNLILSIPIFLGIRQLLRPLRQLDETVNHVREGDLSVRAEIYQSDEIGRLSRHFNDMLDQIESLIDELVAQKMLKREAEIEALQYQIRPHFMYNTLSAIRYAAIFEHADDIAELLQAFTELLRMSASDRGAFITVKEEMHMVENYIMLLQFRYDHSFTVDMAVDPETETFCVPRLLVQPLVENAILHGLDHGRDDNRIRIAVSIKDGFLEIRVEDNGSGMTAEEIRNLLDGKTRSKFSGIGVNNVQERLHLYYGEKGALQYQAAPGKGTAAVIRLPATDDPDRYLI